MRDVILEMNRKGLGMTLVEQDGHLAGVISDGDLRRLLVAQGKDALLQEAGTVMHRNPQTIAPGELAARALHQMETHRITSLVVVDGEGHVEGVLHLHAPARGAVN